MDIESAVAATRPLGNRRAASMVRFLDLFESLGVLAMLLLVVAVVATVEPSFLTLSNLTNVAISASIVAVAGFGMTFAIAMGGFDLSVGSVQALTACVVADLLAESNIPVSIAGALLVGALVGVINGVLIAKLHVPAFVATLGMLGVTRGAALLYTNGQSVLIMGQDDFARLNSARPLGVPLPLLVAMAHEESRMDPAARSHAGAEGLLQLMPATARELRLDPHVPRSNVLAGARYLERMRRRFRSLDLALSAYNAGPNAVERFGAASYPTTAAYVAAVRERAAALVNCR